MPVHHRLAEPQFRIAGVELEPSAQVCNRRLRFAQHLVRPRDQGIELTHDRIARCRQFQAAFKIAKGVVPILTLASDRPQIEQRKRIIGPSFQLLQQDPRVTVELSRPQGLVDIACVPDGQIGPFDRYIRPPQRRQNLFVNAISPANSLAEWKQPDMVDDRVAACSVGAGIARTAHDVRDLLAFSQSLENLFELLSLGRIDDIVCVEPKGIIPRGPRQCGIACGGEIIDPYKIKDACPKRPGDLGRAVGAAGIDDNDLIEHPAHGLETGGKVFFLVPNNHGEADTGPAVGGAGLAYSDRRRSVHRFRRFTQIRNRRLDRGNDSRIGTRIDDWLALIRQIAWNRKV